MIADTIYTNMEHQVEKNDFLKPPKTKTLLWTLCCILAVLIAFGLGLVVGYRRAIFASDFGEHYYRNMLGDPEGQPVVGAMGYGPLTMHGVTGEVVDVATDTIVVRGSNGSEESVLIVSGTPIRDMNENISEQEIAPNDQIVVLGDPDQDGVVEARFVRIFNASSSPLPMAP